MPRQVQELRLKWREMGCKGEEALKVKASSRPVIRALHGTYFQRNT